MTVKVYELTPTNKLYVSVDAAKKAADEKLKEWLDFTDKQFDKPDFSFEDDAYYFLTTELVWELRRVQIGPRRILGGYRLYAQYDEDNSFSIIEHDVHSE